MIDTLTVTRTRATEGETLTLEGELDLMSVELLEDELSSTSAGVVVLDLTGLSFIDSAGIRTIDRAHRKLQEDRRVLLVVAPETSRAAWTFKVAGYEDGLVVESVAEALRSARGSTG